MNKMKKKISKFSIILSSLLILQVFFVNTIDAFANTGTKISYIVSGDPYVGNIIEISVNISNVQNLYG